MLAYAFAPGMRARTFMRSWLHPAMPSSSFSSVGSLSMEKEFPLQWSSSPVLQALLTPQAIKRRIAVAMSGGVDSSVSAYILKKQGHDVVGVYMKNWDEQDETGVCTGEKDMHDAAAVCKYLEIPFYSLDFVKEYWHNVFETFLHSYEKGLTPNPDVDCNRYIKFGALLEHVLPAHPSHQGPGGGHEHRVLNRSVDYVATGHYVRTQYAPNVSFACDQSSVNDDAIAHPPLSSFHSRLSSTPQPPESRHDTASPQSHMHLLTGVDPVKDQSYFLCRVHPKKLDRVLFPLGHLHKHEVRVIAKYAGLLTWDKKDSLGICFVGKKKRFADFLGSYLPSATGAMITEMGVVCGTHTGLYNYTIGQRARIPHQSIPNKITTAKDKSPTSREDARPFFVVGKSLATNELVISDNSDHPALRRRCIVVRSMSWLAGADPVELTGVPRADVDVQTTQQLLEMHLHGGDSAPPAHGTSIPAALEPAPAQAPFPLAYGTLYCKIRSTGRLYRCFAIPVGNAGAGSTVPLQLHRFLLYFPDHLQLAPVAGQIAAMYRKIADEHHGATGGAAATYDEASDPTEKVSAFGKSKEYIYECLGGGIIE